MKLLSTTVIFILMSNALAGVPPESIIAWGRHVGPYYLECHIVTGVDPVLARELLSSADLPNNLPLTCFSECFFSKPGISKSDGSVSKLNIVKSVLTLPHGTEEIPQKCLDKANDITHLCEKAHVIYLCAVEMFSKTNILLKT